MIRPSEVSPRPELAEHADHHCDSDVEEPGCVDSRPDGTPQPAWGVLPQEDPRRPTGSTPRPLRVTTTTTRRDFYVRVRAMGPDGQRRTPMNIAPTRSHPQRLDGSVSPPGGWRLSAQSAGQLHALSRFNDHPDDLEYPLTGAWAVPAMDAVRPLLDWADPTYVYWTYGKIWLPICLAFTAAAYLVYRRRRPQGAERAAWRVQLAAYAVGAIGDRRLLHAMDRRTSSSSGLPLSSSSRSAVWRSESCCCARASIHA